MPTSEQVDLQPIIALLVKIADDHTREQPWLFADAFQEAQIGAWQRLREGYGYGTATHNAKQAVVDVVRGRRMTGSKMKHGGVVDTHRFAEPIFRTSPDGQEQYVYEPPDHSTTDELAGIDARTQLRDAMRALPDREREVVWLVHFEDMSHKDAAALVGISRQAIEQNLARAYGRMRAHLAAEQGDQGAA